MSSNPHSVKARIECARCTYGMDICVPVRVGVGDFLRCDHPTHGGVAKDGSGDIVCPECNCSWHISGDRLSRAVEDAMHRRMQDWKRLGVVIVRCGER